jgi:hypothetical protein
VALSESDAQAWREGKVSRGRGGGGRRGASPFIVVEGGGEGVVKAEELPALMG